VWSRSRHLRTAFGVVLVSVCTAATTCSQGVPAFSHFEDHGDRVVPEALVGNCMEPPHNIGFLGVNDVPFAFTGVGLVKAGFSRLGGPAGDCESDLTTVLAIKVPRSLPPQVDPCLPSVSPPSGVFRAPGCVRTIESAETEDPVAEELSLEGKPGTRIAQARAEVLSILHSENACAGWFETKDPASADTFRSLGYSIDWRGPQDISQSELQSLIVIWHQPYVARATQDSGPYSQITINANGAFFRTFGNVERIPPEGGPAQRAQPRWLLVGPYAGNTPQAQIVTLLHEFGHIIDLLPPDADDLDGKSVRNTDEVLHHCKTEVEAHAKHLRQTAQK
jgi:hypothetical protein